MWSGGEGEARGPAAYILTSIVYLPFRRPLHRPAERVLTDELEVFGGGVHLRPLHVRDDDEDVVATVVVHAPQEHKFGKLHFCPPLQTCGYGTMRCHTPS